MPSQMVGTPPVTVTRSRTIRSSRLGGSRCGPGNTCLAPIITQVNGMPQALAWNIGTTAITVSCSLRPSVSVMPLASECSVIARCEASTPLGMPVVPEV